MLDTETNTAVRNNADWCSAVLRSHGLGYTFGPRAWRSAGPTPPYYPQAITLRPTATAADVLPAKGVKDSFATLDLAPHGYTELFTAQWIRRAAGPATGDAERVTKPDALAEWQRAWHGRDDEPPDVFRPTLLADPSVSVMAVRDGGRLLGGFALNRTGAVAGVSNLFAADPGDLPRVWAATACGVPLVGYESGGDLDHAMAAGFEPVGPLRVWLHLEA
ncbi:hypothetical protein M1L60_01035 [Actinoplanes sp. TRM 88003]|uniref:Uncharacterized protein n=1 Tax=Paractinoplanes aksuensis TaxID=2939490 RepID=A0ABT1DED0_9ACTN|nr:hypothetical protein [Actinoplanes aksuensis]MCO8269169.1 hypothetical protein [Actinoplanes aksuensis]